MSRAALTQGLLLQDQENGVKELEIFRQVVQLVRSEGRVADSSRGLLT